MTMKKFITLLVTLSLLLSLASCGSDKPEESSAAPGTSSGETDVSDVSDVSDAESSEEESGVFVYDVYRGKDRIKENLSLGKTYTVSREASSSYPDSGLLTDGIVYDGAVDSKGVVDESIFAGFVGKKPLEITVDLGSVCTEVANFTASFLVSEKYSCNLPRSFDVAISTDGENFVRVSSVGCAVSDCTGTDYVYDVTLPKGVDCRYAKFIFDDVKLNWMLISEVSVNRISEGAETELISKDTYYTPEPLPEVTENVYFDKSEDNGETVNLISGLYARVSSQMPLYEQYKTEWSNSPASRSKILTDGKRGKYDLNDPAFFHANRGYKRDFVYDLGKIGSVSGYSFSGLHEHSSAVYIPDQIELWLSTDGVNWDCVHQTMPSSDEINPKLYEFSYDLGERYEARFIKVTFTVSAYIWIDEISVFGRKTADGAKKLVYDTDECDYPHAYKPVDEYAKQGIPENVVLLVTYKPDDMARFRLTAEQMIPFIAYVDKDGSILDTFIDGFNISPPYGDTPSGGVFHLDDTKPSNMKDWMCFYDEIFVDGYNTDAIEEAAETVKKALSLGDDFKIKISIPICSPSYTQTDFGDINGDGVSESLESLENRILAEKWSMDYLIKKFEKKNYKNVVLGGFYYQSEKIDTSRNDVMEMIGSAVDYAHEKGYYFIWIPYSESTGFNSCDDLGFDAVTMQPNYMYQPNWPRECVDVCAAICKKFGIGVEIEMDGRILKDDDYHSRFLAYIDEGARLGYMNTVKMYYQDGGPGFIYDCAKSQSAEARDVYDRTFFYARHRYRTDIGGIKTTVFDVNASQKNTFRLETEKIPNFIGAKIRTSPLHGRASIDANGEVTYTPFDDYTGSDTFSVALDYSEETFITVNVK